MIGIFYDLKQDQKRQGSEINERNYSEMVEKFLKSGWNERVLQPYYRATKPLYATQIYIPMSNAEAAPKAFGVQDVVKPRLWMVHYKGQVAAPKDGTYRFAGYSDDWIAVAINGETVMVV